MNEAARNRKKNVKAEMMYKLLQKMCPIWLTNLLSYEMKIRTPNSTYFEVWTYYCIWMIYLGEEIRLSDIKDFPLTLWLIFFICVTYYVAVFPFVSLGV